MSAQWIRAVLTVALRGPGPALLLVSAGGWVAMASLLSGHGPSHSAVASSSAPSMGLWMIMIVAMGPPLMVREVGRVWCASLRRLRHLTTAWFVCGYMGVWLLVGFALAILAEWVAGSPTRIAGTVVLVALWQCSPARQRCLNACHRIKTLRAFGTAALWDSLSYGVASARYCASTCGLVMLLVLLVKEHHLAAMAVAAALTTFERYLPPRRPRWRLPVLRAPSLDWPELPGTTSASRLGRP